MGKKQLAKNSIEKVKSLRSQGYSLPEISALTQVPKTTVYRYIKGVTVLPEFLVMWGGKRGGSKKRKVKKEMEALKKGQALVQTLSKKEKMLYTAALYWAEGSKKDFGLSNTDPELIKVYITILRDVFGISNDRLRVSLRLYEDLDKETCLSFWEKIVGIPKEKFVNVNVLVGKKAGKLKHGMCRIRVAKGGDILKQIMGINKAVSLYLSS